MRFVGFFELIKIPWKNGGGVTRDIAEKRIGDKVLTVDKPIQLDLGQDALALLILVRAIPQIDASSSETALR